MALIDLRTRAFCVFWRFAISRVCALDHWGRLCVFLSASLFLSTAILTLVEEATLKLHCLWLGGKKGQFGLLLSETSEKREYDW